jgi:hypothetical protein
MPTNNPISLGCPGCYTCTTSVGQAKSFTDSTIVEIKENNSMNLANMNVDEPGSCAMGCGYDDHQ